MLWTVATEQLREFFESNYNSTVEAVKAETAAKYPGIPFVNDVPPIKSYHWGIRKSSGERPWLEVFGQEDNPDYGERSSMYANPLHGYVNIVRILGISAEYDQSETSLLVYSDAIGEIVRRNHDSILDQPAEVMVRSISHAPVIRSMESRKFDIVIVATVELNFIRRQ
jgi:hypothetical protein